MDHLKLKNRIYDHYKGLSKNLQLVADYFIENIDKIPFLSVQDVADATGASVASVVRFAQRVGFSGFSEIRQAVTQNLQDNLKDKDRFALIESSELQDDVLTSVANQDIQNINETFKVIEHRNFEKTVDFIFESDHVYTAGLGISYYLSRILAYQLNQVGVRANAFLHDSSPFLEQALLLDHRDLMILFSFPPYSKETIELAEYIQQTKIKAVVVTDKPAAPATFYAKLNLIVKSKNMLYTNSFAAITVLINAIATECARRDKSRARQMIEKSSQIQADFVISGSVKQNQDE